MRNAVNVVAFDQLVDQQAQRPTRMAPRGAHYWPRPPDGLRTRHRPGDRSRVAAGFVPL